MSTSSCIKIKRPGCSVSARPSYRNWNNSYSNLSKKCKIQRVSDGEDRTGQQKAETHKWKFAQTAQWRSLQVSHKQINKEMFKIEHQISLRLISPFSQGHRQLTWLDEAIMWKAAVIVVLSNPAVTQDGLIFINDVFLSYIEAWRARWSSANWPTTNNSSKSRSNSTDLTPPTNLMKLSAEQYPCSRNLAATTRWTSTPPPSQSMGRLLSKIDKTSWRSMSWSSGRRRFASSH